MILQRAPDSRHTLLMVLALLPAGVLALPEDAQQKIDADFSRMDMQLDQGLVVYVGDADKPACITQGSLEICGAEIRLEQAEDGSLLKVTATGTPARFQQQPAADQAVIHARGATLVFDNVAQLVTADGDAEFSQAGTEMSHQHIEYNLETRRASLTGSGEQGRMTIPAARATGN